MESIYKNSVVYIIESPSPIDFLDSRSEGESLSSALRLGEIENRVFKALDSETFEACFERIAEHFLVTLDRSSNERVIPFLYLHFSCHGNEGGIALTNKQFYSWKALSEIILKFAASVDLIDPRYGVAYLTVCFSSCNGANSSRLLDGGPPYPCYVTVGPTGDVTWPDALTGFVTFYHLALLKGIKGYEAVKQMNYSAGLNDAFCATSIPDELKDKLKKQIQITK